MGECVVRFNCRHRWDCTFCDNYGMYQPFNPKIYSPRQLEKFNQRAEERKELKQSEKSKQGKRNKIAGYRSETSMVKKYKRWGFEAARQPMSGAFKGANRSDIKVYIKGKWRLHEDKKRSDVQSYYDRTEDYALRYEDFCVLMNEEDYHGLLLGIVPKIEDVPDKRIKTIHGFFEQDNADIVSIRQHGKRKSVYAVTIKLYNELAGV